MDKVIFYKKSHPSFILICVLVPFAIAWGILPTISIYAYFSTHELSTKEFALCFPVGSIIWIALIVMIPIFLKYSSFRTIVFCDDEMFLNLCLAKELLKLTKLQK